MRCSMQHWRCNVRQSGCECEAATSGDNRSTSGCTPGRIPSLTGDAAMYDLVIRNGTIVDGTGAAQTRRRHRDHRRRARPGGRAPSRGDAREVIDADGLVVTPGFVDVHTHYDGQVTFDDVLDPSAGHGVTTVVLGSCGLGFAPARPEDHDRLIETMECVEDIPGDVLRAGAAVEVGDLPRVPRLPRVAQLLDGRRHADRPHRGAHLRDGRAGHQERGRHQRRHRRDGPPSCARGSTPARSASRPRASSPTPRPTASQVPGTFAGEDELFGIAAAMSDAPYCVFQLAQSGADGDDAGGGAQGARLDAAPLGGVRSAGVVPAAAVQAGARPLEGAARRARGRRAPTARSSSRRSPTARSACCSASPTATRSERPTFVELVRGTTRSTSLDELVAELAKPEVQAAILSEDDTVATGGAYDTMGQLPVATCRSSCFPLEDDLDYEPTADRSVAARAEAAGVRPAEFVYDTMLERGGRAMFVLPFFNYADGDHDAIYAMLTHPASVPGLGDGGAHLATICDASMPTYQLSHWVRGRTRGPRAEPRGGGEDADPRHRRAVRPRRPGHARSGQEGRPQRDRSRRGSTSNRPASCTTCPGGGTRLLQDAEGYAATIVSGVVTRQDDRDTGARPGRLVRGARPA